MIDIVDLTQHYGVRPVLKNVSLRIERGELIAVVGPNGMGKTTLLAAVAGVLSPQTGHVEINGLRRRSSPENELAIRRQIVYLPDQAWLPRNRTGREFLLAIGRIYGTAEEKLFEHAQRLLSLFNLEKQGEWPIRTYSNGQQKKIAICSALITDAPIMLLDEPFSGGLDPEGILVLQHVLLGLKNRDDVTVMMTTPVPALVEDLADRVLVLRDGGMLAFDTPGGLREMTGCDGKFSEVLQRLMYPETLGRIERYLSEPL